MRTILDLCSRVVGLGPGDLRCPKAPRPLTHGHCMHSEVELGGEDFDRDQLEVSEPRADKMKKWRRVVTPGLYISHTASGAFVPPAPGRNQLESSEIATAHEMHEDHHASDARCTVHKP